MSIQRIPDMSVQTPATGSGKVDVLKRILKTHLVSAAEKVVVTHLPLELLAIDNRQALRGCGGAGDVQVVSQAVPTCQRKSASWGEALHDIDDRSIVDSG